MYSAYNELFENIRSEFLSALGKIDFMQTDILKKILKNNSYTNYGKKYSFEKIKTVSEYQEAVPVTEYKDYEVYIKEIMLGKKNVLTSEDVILLEPTGGSSGELKLIPYTKGLKNAFNNGIKPWLSDLFLNFPDIINRPMYWSITPKVKQQGVKSEVKIGFENDIDYLDIDFADIISKKIVIPPVLNNDDVIETSAVFLSQFPSLGLISVWSPSLLLLLVEKLKNSPKNIWKDLKLISCWDDGNSKMYFDKLKSLFPDVKIQGKGLLSTEALISVPIENMGKVPCFTSHFLEFTDIETKKLKCI